MKLTFLLLLAAAGGYGQSCNGRCGDNDPTQSCECNSDCTKFNDCCSDYEEICMSCMDRCDEAFLKPKPCQCNNQCNSHNNCCPDYDDECGGGVTDAELRALTEEMYAAMEDAVGDLLTIDLQGKGDSGDLAPGPLFTSVPDAALNGPTISLLRQLQDNYVPDVKVAEDEDEVEIAEKDDFLDAMISTQIMQLVQNFLQDKKLLTGSLRDKLDEIWFTMYPRTKSGPRGSSGFEHSFVGELKNGQVSGFHNWVNFYKEEQKGNSNYEGWSGFLNIDDKCGVLMDHFTWYSEPKKIGSMFVGTPPELELATYTVCFLARPNSLCPVQMNNKLYHAQTWDITYEGKVYVGSAYPDIGV
ncbi:poly(U)-specific endoribonuclease-like [Homarus americanus]|uniref:Poly(U)-specific endoribonuclease-like n=1 Tax=Homarus americanus TaxID=6706 RepID=A0A8J5MMT4_HOMAM|nr:poly(U)-specific endoribonuclease-like [Homarus americanus]KAG7157298.1 Poly(U)-specific endoribonuclease-like [Homarus americanus]